VPPEVVVPRPPVRPPPVFVPPVAAAVAVALLLPVAVGVARRMPVVVDAAGAVALALLMPVAVDAAAVSLVVLLGTCPVLVREALPAGRHGSGDGDGELQRQAAAAAACQHQARGGGIQLSDGVPWRPPYYERGERRRRGRCPARGEFVRAVAGEGLVSSDRRKLRASG